MKFQYFAGEQRTTEWFDKRLGKPSASNLSRWMAVSKRDGKPLKARLDYERELMFERTFGVPFEKFNSLAMQEGIDFEELGREQYTKITGRKVVPVGCWYNEWFAASPDGGVEDEGIVEIKWLKDTNWTEVLATQDPMPDHQYQVQGQLFASGRKWCDYVACNMHTKKVIILRIEPDKEFHKEIEQSLKSAWSVEPFNKQNVFDIKDELPEIEPAAENAIEGF